MKKAMHHRIFPKFGEDSEEVRTSVVRIKVPKPTEDEMLDFGMCPHDSEGFRARTREWLRSIRPRLQSGELNARDACYTAQPVYLPNTTLLELVVDVGVGSLHPEAVDDTCQAVQHCFEYGGQTHVTIEKTYSLELSAGQHRRDLNNYSFNLLQARAAHARLAQLLVPVDSALDASLTCQHGTCLLLDALPIYEPYGPWHRYDDERVQFVKQLLAERDVSNCDLTKILRHVMPKPGKAPCDREEVRNKETIARLLLLHGAPRLQEWLVNVSLERYDWSWGPLIDIVSNPVLATANAVWADVVSDTLTVIDVLRRCEKWRFLYNWMIVSRIAHHLWRINNSDKYLRNAHTWTDKRCQLRTLEDFEVMAYDIIKDRHLTVAQVMQCVKCKPKMQSRLPPHRKCECLGTDVSLSPPNKRARLQ